MDKNKIYVTSCINPDLDGIACMIAYTEFLNKKGENAVPVIFGNFSKEAEFVLNGIKINEFQKGEEVIKEDSTIVLVDASELRVLSDKIILENVIEIIDHRRLSEAHKFINAKSQVEMIGAAATLVAERYHNSNIEVSKESALLLYSAIISNTINLKAKVTSERDFKMAGWLRSKIEVSNKFIEQMFIHKSKFDKPISEILIEENFISEINGHTLGISQFEIVHAMEFVNKNQSEIVGIIKEIIETKSIEHQFLTCIDLIEGYNVLIAVKENTKKLLVEVLGIVFNGDVAIREGIIMRKEIAPLIKNELEKAEE